jgi:iron complex outermembrane recepter protein
MKVAGVILLLFLSGILSLNQSVAGSSPILPGVFSGKIIDGKTNLPLQGASVYISDIKIGGSSDAKGFFELKNLPPGKHLIEISHVGYTSIIEWVDIINDTRKDYSLTESIVENNAVIVTGVGAATQSKKTPFQISVMRKEELLKSASSNIIEALAKKPGIATLSTGPAISKPVIRGLGYNRVLTVNDGVRQEGQQWGDEHGIEIDEASINKVEILKGPASLIYGSDATAGVINIITNVPVEANTIKANVNAGYQTNYKARALNANVAGNINGINWNLYGSVVGAAAYKNKYDGPVLNSNFNEKNAGGYVGYNNSWGYSHLLFSNFDLTAGLIDGERDSLGFFIKPVAGGGVQQASDTDFNSTSPEIPYQHIRHFKVVSDNNIKVGENHLVFNLGFQHNQREEFGNPDDLNERALYFDLKTFTYTAQYHFAVKNGWNTSVGINGMQQQNTNLGVEQLIPNYELFDIGGYVYAQKTIKKITLSGGARYDTRQINVSALMADTAIKGAAFNNTYSNVSGSIGAAAILTKQLNLKLNIARGFRAPAIPELASNGTHEGTLRYEYGNADLKSETSTQFDAGLDFNTEHVSFGLSGFYNIFNNFIFYRKLASANGGDSTINVDGIDIAAFLYGQQKATLSGLEVSVDIHPHPLDWLHIQNTFSYVSGVLAVPVEGAKYLPNIPAAKLITEFNSNFKKINNNIKNVYINFDVDFTFAKNNIFFAYNTETASPGYTLLNMGVGGDFVTGRGIKLFSLNISGNNLADVAYQNHLSRLRYGAENLATGRMGVFNMGRNFSIKLNIPFTFRVNDK